MPPGGWQQPLGGQAPAVVPGELASWGSRVGATLLDGLIVTVGIIVLVIVVVVLAQISSVAALVVGIPLGIAGLLATLGYGAYFVAREGEHNGQTPGKQMVGIRAVRDNGQPFDFGQGLLREFVVKNLLFQTVGGFFFYLPTLVDWLWPLWDDQDRALHDMVISTHVVKAD